MSDRDDFKRSRLEAALSANAEDAALWRWFSDLLEERRIRWCNSNDAWLVTVDHRHVATQSSFDEAIREAKAKTDSTASLLREGRLSTKHGATAAPLPDG